MKRKENKAWIDLALENLSEKELKELRQNLASDPQFQEELVSVKELLAAIALNLEPEPPAPELKARLLDGICGKNRFLPFLSRLTELFDLSPREAQAYLERLDDSSAWKTVLPGVQTIKIQAGPATAGAESNFLRVLPGASFPYHTHRGLESSLLLQGCCRSEDGVINRAGDLLYQETGTAHSFQVISEQAVIAAVVCFGIDFIKPPDRKR
ncbi:cupin domain-containing protein [Nitrosococcus oceani]|uniref:cupin domain-containing protein n=1 Tax=Nitrosococcus oceani TaxID=1229 RepID=UPI0004E95398|nr:cupin domain-containing protein [Nitrosococcus oceani]KFI22549.1 cupin [Nitrosococcus oceani]